MNGNTVESCANCANIHICSGPDYIDGSCYPGFKPIDDVESDYPRITIPIERGKNQKNKSKV